MNFDDATLTQEDLRTLRKLRAIYGHLAEKRAGTETGDIALMVEQTMLRLIEKLTS